MGYSVNGTVNYYHRSSWRITYTWIGLSYQRFSEKENASEKEIKPIPDVQEAMCMLMLYNRYLKANVMAVIIKAKRKAVKIG